MFEMFQPQAATDPGDLIGGGVAIDRIAKTNRAVAATAVCPGPTAMKGGSALRCPVKFLSSQQRLLWRLFL